MKSDAELYVKNPNNVKRHRFSPLIHYTKTSRKIERNKEAENLYKQGLATKPKFKPKIKDRNIFYCSHIDGYIYSYYNFSLQKKYEDFLLNNNLINNVIAYRAIEKNGIKFCNIHLAEEVFKFALELKNSKIVCFDLSKFFDKLCIDILKENWKNVLGLNKLPDDHFSVYQSLVNFKYIEEKQIIEEFRNKFEESPRKHGLEKDSGGSSKNRICDYSQLRDLNKKIKQSGNKLIKSKKELDITGIPQGTPISGLLSNIFMICFDIELKKYTEDLGGFYRRYSDDIIVVIPDNISFSEIAQNVQRILKKNCGSGIKLNDSKTENRVLGKNSETVKVTDEHGKPSKIQYLGFHFDGKSVTLRNSSISKDRCKTTSLIKKLKKGKGKINTLEVFKKKSSRKITKYNDVKSKGFIYYAERSDEVHGGLSKIKQQTKKNDRFIKREIERNL